MVSFDAENTNKILESPNMSRSGSTASYISTTSTSSASSTQTSKSSTPKNTGFRLAAPGQTNHADTQLPYVAPTLILRGPAPKKTS